MHMFVQALLARLQILRDWPFSRHLRVGLVAGLLTALMSLFLPNYYKSSSTILPMDTSGGGGIGGIAAAAAAFGIGIGTPGGGDANWVDILNSRWIKENLLKTEFKFHTRAYRFGADQPRQETLYAYLEQPNLDRAIKKLDHDLVAIRDIKSNIITVTMESRSAELSQQVVLRATALLEEFVLHMNRTRGGEKAAFATDRLNDARKEMKKAEDAFQSFLEANRNYQTSNEPAVRIRGGRLEAELRLYQNLVATLATNREQALLDAQNDVPVLNILDAGNLPLDKSWPARSTFVIVAFLLATAGHWAWVNRAWVKENLLDGTRGAE